jgi:8-oxo-dGTP diphosphatase
VSNLPYKIATLCYLFDPQGRVLLIRRLKVPNQGLYSPIGGKLDQALGESPTQCALREIAEETGLKIEKTAIKLNGMISESNYENKAHWLMFLFEVMTPVRLDSTMTPEGSLEWFEPGEIFKLDIPSTDRHIIWPLFWRYRAKKFFAAHISCENEKLTWHLEQPIEDVSLQETIDSDL